MTQMRRLDDVSAKGDLFERGHKSLVRSFDISRAEFDDLQRQRQELIVALESGVMLLQPKGSRAWVCYGFDSIEAFRRDFRPTFDALLPLLKPDEAPGGIFIWFTDAPNRPYVEPVLSECLFSPQYEWMQMDLPALPDDPAPADDAVPGFVLRSIDASELDAMAEIDVAAFPDDAWTPQDFIRAANNAAEMRGFEERDSGRLVGYIGLRIEEGRVGKVSFLAVLPEYQRRGLGEAMVRWGLAWFRSQGMRRATLNVHIDTAPAVALYRKLGFVPGQRGLTYRRPTSKKELDEIASKRRGTFIKFGGWR